MIGGSVISAIFGLLRSFTTGYQLFLTFEILDAITSSGIYSAVNVLGKNNNFITSK